MNAVAMQLRWAIKNSSYEIAQLPNAQLHKCALETISELASGRCIIKFAASRN